MNTPPDTAAGASYPWSYRAAAALTVPGLALGAWLTRNELAALHWNASGLLLVAAVVALVVMGSGHILFSRTALRDRVIEHGWLWIDRIDWRDVSQVQLLHWPALAWVVAPRLTVRARGRGRHRIPMADARTLQLVRGLVFGPAD
ncbi:MAG: hypothetical protein IBJ14_00025 [Hydrogenophaga sp.]|nr:hypothetical protein [Hydrogenophaga sp.]